MLELHAFQRRANNELCSGTPRPEAIIEHVKAREQNFLHSFSFCWTLDCCSWVSRASDSKIDWAELDQFHFNLVKKTLTQHLQLGWSIGLLLGSSRIDNFLRLALKGLVNRKFARIHRQVCDKFKESQDGISALRFDIIINCLTFVSQVVFTV
jgi:hypothetical protein